MLFGSGTGLSTGTVLPLQLCGEAWLPAGRCATNSQKYDKSSCGDPGMSAVKEKLPQPSTLALLSELGSKRGGNMIGIGVGRRTHESHGGADRWRRVRHDFRVVCRSRQGGRSQADEDAHPALHVKKVNPVEAEETTTPLTPTETPSRTAP